MIFVTVAQMAAPKRSILVLALAGALGAAIAGTASGRVVVGTRPAACQTVEKRIHTEAVFGHFSSRAQGLALARRARKVGFKGIKIEDEGCGDFEVEIDGADKLADRTSFAREAQKAGFPVTFEQTGPPTQPPAGQAFGTFARLRTIGAANILAGRLASSGFRYIEIVRIGGTWAVVLPQVPVRNALSIAAEAHRAGFRIALKGAHAVHSSEGAAQ